jgi:Transposase
VPDATFACPDLTTFTRLDELGLEVIGQRLEPDCAVLACRVVGPTEAINGRLEHLRGSALGFRNLTNYIARSLLEAGGFRPQLPPGL